MAAMNLKIVGDRAAIAKLGKEEIVILPLRKYKAILQLMEDLEDIADSVRSMEEYRSGKPRPFADYVTKRRAKRCVQNSKR